MKKSFIFLGSLVTLVSPVLAVVSCWGAKSLYKYGADNVLATKANTTVKGPFFKLDSSTDTALKFVSKSNFIGGIDWADTLKLKTKTVAEAKTFAEVQMNKISALTEAGQKINIDGTDVKTVSLFNIKKGTAAKTAMVKTDFKTFYEKNNDVLTDVEANANNYVAAADSFFTFKEATDLSTKFTFGSAWGDKAATTNERKLDLGTTRYDLTKWKVTFVENTVTSADSLYKIMYTEGAVDKEVFTLTKAQITANSISGIGTLPADGVDLSDTQDITLLNYFRNDVKANTIADDKFIFTPKVTGVAATTSNLKFGSNNVFVDGATTAVTWIVSFKDNYKTIYEKAGTPTKFVTDVTKAEGYVEADHKVYTLAELGKLVTSDTQKIEINGENYSIK